MKRKLFYLALIGLLTTAGCKKFIDVNVSPNVPLDVQEKLLLAPIEYNVAHNIAAGDPGSVNANHFMQIIALNQPVPNQGTYLIVPAGFDGVWNSIYVNNLQNLRILNEKGEANGNYNYSGIAKILTAYSLAAATDFWGDIPYSQALKGDLVLQPMYDKQEDIYKQIQVLLDNGIADINKNTGLKPGSDDFYYNGDMAKWRRAAFTLKARYFMRLTKAPGYSASTQADLALAALQNGFQATGGNTEDMRLVYPGGAGTESRWFNLMLPITTIVMSSYIVDYLKNTNDPRLPVLIAPAKSNGAYTGRPIGTPTTGSLESYSLLGSYYGSRTSPVFLITYSEALFIRAEATLIKSGAAAAQPIFQDGIRSHMAKLGIDNVRTNDYITARGTLTPANALQRIIEEKVLANFMSIENFNDWRRTGFPVLVKVPNAVSEIPRRFLYPEKELNTNRQPQHSAVMTDRVWWDK